MSSVPDNILMNETEKLVTTTSTKFVAILSGANGVPPVDSTASARAHFEIVRFIVGEL
jgi:hypothetical protein